METTPLDTAAKPPLIDPVKCLPKQGKSASILETLSIIPLFHGLAEENLTQLAQASYFRSYKKREYVCRPDEQVNILFFLLEGVVQMGLTNADGKEIGIMLLEPGQWFGELALLDGQYQPTTIIALQPSRALLLPRQPFLEVLRSHPTLVLDMLTIAHRRLYHVLDQMKRVQFGTPYQRVARVLLALAEQHGSRSVSNDSRLSVPYGSTGISGALREHHKECHPGAACPLVGTDPRAAILCRRHHPNAIDIHQSNAAGIEDGDPDEGRGSDA